MLYICFISTDESILLDLKHLLIEAKQKVPDFLANLQSENEQYLNIGGNCCFYPHDAVLVRCYSCAPPPPIKACLVTLFIDFYEDFI